MARRAHRPDHLVGPRRPPARVTSAPTPEDTADTASQRPDQHRSAAFIDEPNGVQYAGRLRRLEIASEARLAHISHLQEQIRRLREDKRLLEDQVAKLVRENRSISATSLARLNQTRSLRRVVHRQQHVQFWQLFQSFGWVDNFEAFAADVAYDPTRMFALMLLVDINKSQTSPELIANAQDIVDLFDPVYYLSEQQDVVLAGRNPMLHYLTEGYREQRNPNPLFDIRYYRTQAGSIVGDPLRHYITSGALAGLKPHPLFDGQYYWKLNPDVHRDGINPLFHYQVWGYREQRDPSPLFDTEYFLTSGGGQASITGNPLHDYLLVPGEAGDPHPLFSDRLVQRQLASAEPAEAPLVLYETDNRLWHRIRPHPLFDLTYLSRFGALTFPEDVSPLSYVCQLLQERDVDPTVLFDSRLYRYQVEKEQGCALTEPAIIHYIKHGYEDKRLRPNLMFDPEAYLSRNQIEVSGPELVHYWLLGDRKGYYCHELFSAAAYNAARVDDEPITALEHFLLTDDGSLVESHPHMARPLDRRAMAFVADAVRSDGEFDADFYRAVYPDLASLTAAEAETHFQQAGRSEGRSGSPRHMMEQQALRVRDIPLGFFADEYLALNGDLVEFFSPEYYSLFRHYLTVGRLENRRIGRWQFHLDPLDIEIPTSASPVRVERKGDITDVCVLMHIFYDDLWPELAAYANNFRDVSRDVFINVVDIAWSLRFQRELREVCPGAFVQLSNDNGRDIGGFVRLLDNVDIERYQLFAFMHTKKSPHIAPERGVHWRRSLLNTFAGSPQVVSDSVATFRADPKVGLIAAKEWRATDIGNNAAHYERLLDHFKIDQEHRGVEYASGTMFMIRSDIVRHLYDGLKQATFEYGGDKDVEFHRDGQIAHGVERVIGNLVRQLGYRIQWN